MWWCQKIAEIIVSARNYYVMEWLPSTRQLQRLQTMAIMETKSTWSTSPLCTCVKAPTSRGIAESQLGYQFELKDAVGSRQHRSTCRNLHSSAHMHARMHTRQGSMSAVTPRLLGGRPRHRAHVSCWAFFCQANNPHMHRSVARSTHKAGCMGETSGRGTCLPCPVAG